MACRSVEKFLNRSKYLRSKEKRAMDWRVALYHSSEETRPVEEAEEETLSSEWYEKAFSKLTKWSHLFKDMDLIDGRLVNVNENTRLFDAKLEEKMHMFKSLARVFIGHPSMQESMQKNVIDLYANSKCPPPLFFSRPCERQSMIVNSLTKVANYLNVSAQQRKVVRFNLCPQVTQHKIWTGALEEMLNGLKAEIDALNHCRSGKQIKLAQQIVVLCLKVLDSAISYDSEATSWMRLSPKNVANTPASHQWEDVLQMFIDLIECLGDEKEFVLQVAKLDVMKEGLHQIKDVLIDKNSGYKETRHQHGLVSKKLTKTLGHSSRCLFTLLLYYLYASVQDLEVEVCGGVYSLGRGDKFCLCMGKILTSSEEKMVQSGVKQLDRALGLFKFVWEAAGMKGDLELQGHLWCVGANNRSLTYRENTFLLHGISF